MEHHGCDVDYRWTYLFTHRSHTTKYLPIRRSIHGQVLKMLVTINNQYSDQVTFKTEKKLIAWANQNIIEIKDHTTKRVTAKRPCLNEQEAVAKEETRLNEQVIDTLPSLNEQVADKEPFLNEPVAVKMPRLDHPIDVRGSRMKIDKVFTLRSNPTCLNEDPNNKSVEKISASKLIEIAPKTVPVGDTTKVNPSNIASENKPATDTPKLNTNVDCPLNNRTDSTDAIENRQYNDLKDAAGSKVNTDSSDALVTNTPATYVETFKDFIQNNNYGMEMIFPTLPCKPKLMIPTRSHDLENVRDPLQKSSKTPVKRKRNATAPLRTHIKNCSEDFEKLIREQRLQNPKQLRNGTAQIRKIKRKRKMKKIRKTNTGRQYDTNDTKSVMIPITGQIPDDLIPVLRRNDFNIKQYSNGRVRQRNVTKTTQNVSSPANKQIPSMYLEEVNPGRVNTKRSKRCGRDDLQNANEYAEYVLSPAIVDLSKTFPPHYDKNAEQVYAEEVKLENIVEKREIEVKIEPDDEEITIEENSLVKFEEYEVVEQENDCNVLILKI